jgi:uncharacterized protein YjiS (DUF1127 family)
MSTITAAQTAIPNRPFTGFLTSCRKAFQEWSERQKVRAALSDLDGRDLKDIGITRADIDYVATNRAADPRSAVSNGR